MNNRQPPQFPNAHHYDLGFDPEDVQAQTYAHAQAQAQARAHAHAHAQAQQAQSQAGTHPHTHAQLQPEPNTWQYNHYIPTTTTSNNASSISYSWPQTNPAYVPAIPSEVNILEQQQHQHHQQQQQYLQRSFSPGVAYHTPAPENYYLATQAATPYAYHASPQFSGYPSPVSRSMSVSALSSTNIDQSTSNLQPRQAQPQPSNTYLPTPRQIRFVSTDGQPHAKRRRINAACLTCRKRKTRCSGERPVCKTCSNNGHTCAGYADKAQKAENEKGPNDEDDEDDDVSHSSSPNRQNTVTQIGTGRQQQSAGQIDSYQANFSNPRSRQMVHNPLVSGKSPTSDHVKERRTALGGRAPVPYFRYFGPTAIVPGFKQMVVLVKDGQECRGSHPSPVTESPLPTRHIESNASLPESSSLYSELPYYNTIDAEPTSPLITTLCKTFFRILGSNYPFLQKDRFLKDLDTKRVDAILVNAICAVSARFSSDLVLAQASNDTLPLDEHGKVKRAFRGQPFAQRAMSALIETFPCPTLAVTQACLLLAYEEFGSDRDSGLWMYLGTSIRMAQDLGIQKLDGLQLVGRIGPTPKTTKDGEEGKMEEKRRADLQKHFSRLYENEYDYEDRKASEQERIDTFWSIFFLDRAVSSGVGRPVTLRDQDIEISFPYLVEEIAENQLDSQYPDPFPAMIRIVHMYGRVADVLNNIRVLAEVTSAVLHRLAEMEKSLTGIYQKLSPKLHFNATNFQHYVKAEQGTNFILLHFWFHTLIVLLHQPTLLHSFEGQIQQLFQHSRELSMSSAKTIADILAFAELIDVKSFIGNPFTSQPMYVAACAFLAEAAAHASQPPSRGDSPAGRARSGLDVSIAKHAERRMFTKHSLLASAANQNYQRCYKALKTLGAYWAGCRYILTALDQKAKGLLDPLLFTAEDVDVMPSTQPSFTTPGWRNPSVVRSLEPLLSPDRDRRSILRNDIWPSEIDIGNAIGWSLTGTADSQVPHMSLLYSNGDNTRGSHNKLAQTSSVRGPTLNDQQDLQIIGSTIPTQSPSTRLTQLSYDPASTAETDLLLGLHSTFSPAKLHTITPQPQLLYNSAQPVAVSRREVYGTSNPKQHSEDLFIETQDIDMTCQTNFTFNDRNMRGGDMIPWLEYLPQDVLDYFGDNSEMVAPFLSEDTPSDGLVPPSGPGPPP